MSNELEQKAQELADNLVGSCDLTPDEVFEVDGLAEILDEICGCCTECGWWCYRDELNDDWVCEDCNDG